MRWADPGNGTAGGLDLVGLLVALLGFALVAYLGLEGGGYDPLVHDQVGIGVWWAVIALIAAGALPRARPGRLGLLALGLLAAFVGWTALSLSWTESAERTAADLARVAGYLGVFALALGCQGRDLGRRLLGGVAAAIVLVAGVGLLSRLYPDLFPAAGQTAAFLTPGRERLSYPIHYWNGLAALIAIGLPLVVHFAAGARSLAGRGLAAASVPLLVVTIFYTLSRAGIAAAAVAVALYLVLSADRLPKLLSLALGGAGGLVVALAADHRQSLQDGLLDATARSQGDEMLVIVIVVCLAVGALQVALAAALRGERRPYWSHVPRPHAIAATGVAAVVVAIALLAAGAPGRAADAWDEFKQPSSPGQGTGRLGSAAGQSRYQFWSSAARQNASDPLTGTGSGTFEFWWNRDGDVGEIVRDTHSLYLQTLGELGVVGLALLLGFLFVVVGGGFVLAMRADAAERSLRAAALAGCAAFCVTAGFDWMWQIPVIPAALLLLAAVLVGPSLPDLRGEASEPRSLSLPLRGAVAAAGIAAIVAIAIPLASTSLVRQSEADARAGDLTGALDAARSAENAQPSAATPRLQQALVLEELDDLDAAADAARAATERESTNWRTWLVLSRVEAERGRAAAAVAAYRRARSLNPRSSLFDR